VGLSREPSLLCEVRMKRMEGLEDMVEMREMCLVSLGGSMSGVWRDGIALLGLAVLL
jgi:hypothetical protein